MMKDVHMAPVEDVNTEKTNMSLQSALPSLSLETFNKDSPVLDEEEESFRLHLSEDDDDNGSKEEDHKALTDIPQELEDDILDKFAGENGSSDNLDELADESLLDDKSDVNVDKISDEKGIGCLENKADEQGDESKTCAAKENEESSVAERENEDSSIPKTENDSLDLETENGDSSVSKTENEGSSESETGNGDSLVSETENDGSSEPETGNGDSLVSKTDNEGSSVPEAENGDCLVSKTENEDSKVPETENENISVLRTENEDALVTETETEDSSVSRRENEDSSVPETEDEASSVPKSENEDSLVSKTENEGSSVPETENNEEAIKDSTSSNLELKDEEMEEELDGPKCCADSKELKEPEKVDDSSEVPEALEASKSSTVEEEPNEEIKNKLNTSSLIESMDTEDLLQVTTVKDVDDFMDMTDADKDGNSCDSSEKDEAEDAGSEDKEVESEDIEMDEETEKDIMTKELESEDIEMDDETEKDVTKEDEVLDETEKDATKDEEALDIEENVPDAEEIDNEVDKEYRDLSKEDSGDKGEDSSDGAAKCESDDSASGEKDKISAKVVESKDSSEVDADKDSLVNSDSVGGLSENSTKADSGAASIDGETKSDDSLPKPGKRSLSSSDGDVDPKKIKLSVPEPEPVKVPEKINVLNAFSEFMKSKSLKKLSRASLEEFCLQKMCEVIINKSELGELRHQLQVQEQMVEVWRKETVAQTKQVKDLEIVNKKLLSEIKLRNEKDKPVVPVIITRSVGLQVKLADPSATSSPLKRRISKGPETPPAQNTPNKVMKTLAPKTTVTPPTATKQIFKVVPKAAPTALLSQALQKDTQTQSNANTAEPKGVIDLTDEDDKNPPAPARAKPNTAPSKPNAAPAKPNAAPSKPNAAPSKPNAAASKTPVRNGSVTQGVHLVTNNGKTSVPVTVNNGQKLFYVVHSPNQQINQNVITSTSELTKPGAPKTLMFKLQNGIIGQTNGIIPTIQNGNSTLSVLPQQVSSLRAGQQVRLQSPTSTTRNTRQPPRHPAPLPQPPPNVVTPGRLPVPPKPHLNIRKSGQGIVLSWKMPYNLDMYEQIASYQLYAYQETSAAPSSDMWRKVGDVKALALPMACTLTQFADGNKYYFAVRPVDVQKRIGAFSDPEPIML